MQEIFKDIHGYEGLYQVSNLGRIKSLKRSWIAGINSKRKHDEIILKVHKIAGEYLGVCLTKHGNQKDYLVHRLVAQTFIPNPDNKPEVNHKDGIKSHCYVDNLEWNTISENKIHALKMGLRSSGENQVQSKLTNEMARLIRNSILLTQQELANIFDVRKQTIWKIIHNKSYKFN
jgi:hypothetical protein